MGAYKANVRDGLAVRLRWWHGGVEVVKLYGLEVLDRVALHKPNRFTIHQIPHNLSSVTVTVQRGARFWHIIP
jgi:hypothetical protein